jgi:two-component sensor histidine kinase
MALHELATNAAKYGALSTPEGRVAVRWRRERTAEEGGGTLRIEWVEEGGPPVRPAAGAGRRPGFGTRLIEGAIRRQLGGTVTLDWAPEGLRCTLAIPARRLEASAPAAGGAA